MKILRKQDHLSPKAKPCPQANVSQMQPNLQLWMNNKKTCRARSYFTCCAGPLGAVRLLLRPSWFTAEPASIASAADAADTLRSSLRRNMSAPTPSDRTYPSAVQSLHVSPGQISDQVCVFLLPFLQLTHGSVIPGKVSAQMHGPSCHFSYPPTC